MNYHAYLNSPAWRSLAAVIRARAGYKCERCGSKRKLQVHHLTYERIFRERPQDLVCLCRKCHEKAHGRDAWSRIKAVIRWMVRR